MAAINLIVGLQLLFSAVLYIGTISLNIVYLCFITQQVDQKQWFLPCLGFLLISSVILQLVSAVLLLLDKGDNLSARTSAAIAVLHILQLGFLWRHVTLFRQVEPNDRTREQKQLDYLQLLFTFTTLLPLLFIQAFVILRYEQYHWIALLVLVVNCFGSCWFVASFRHYKHKLTNKTPSCDILGTVCRLVWRSGEVSSRIISLTIFATLFYYWIFLILGLHGLTMLVCLCTTILGIFEKPGISRSYKVLVGLVVAYIYSFCFIDFGSENLIFRYSLYYVIMFFENAALTVVWYLHTDEYYTVFHKNAIVIFIACAFFTGIVFLIVSLKCFDNNLVDDPEREHIYVSDGCINCKLSMCSKHCIKMQRPFSAGYMSHYQKALASGQYYKNILQDSFLDTDGELLNSSGEHCQIRDADIESVKASERKQYTSVQASGTYTHKRFFDSNSTIANGNDTDSISSANGSGLYDEDWRKKSDLTLLSQLSAADALSLVSSRTQLLTDSWDNLINQENNATDEHKHAMKIDILSSLIRKDLDTSFFSDGYTTDHTLNSYQLPVTVLAKKRSLERKKVEPAYSTASDSTDCTICAFMRQHPSSPEESRRNFKIYDDIPEETQSEPILKKKHEYKTSKRTNKHKRSVPRPYITSDSDDQSRHRYEKSSNTSRQKRRDMIRITDNKPLRNTSNNNHSTQNNIKSEILNTFVLVNPESKCQKTKTKNLLENVKHDNEMSASFTDSEDSAFPRNTPVKDRTFPEGKSKEHKDLLYSKPFKQGYAINNAKILASPSAPLSDSGDSVCSRNTPLNVYILALDNDKDGTSESSCEMII